jgi:hypothetical protein
VIADGLIVVQHWDAVGSQPHIAFESGSAASEREFKGVDGVLSRVGAPTPMGEANGWA